MSIYQTFKDNGIDFKPATKGGAYIIEDEQFKKTEIGERIVFYSSTPQTTPNIFDMFISNRRYIGKDPVYLNIGHYDHIRRIDPLKFQNNKSNATRDSYLFENEIKPIVFKLIDLGLENYNDFEAYKMYEYPTEVKGSDFNLAIKCLRNLKKNNVSLVK